MIGTSLSTEWEKLLLFFNSQPFNITDPLFNKDISFYVFNLPIIKSFMNIIDSSLFLSLMGAIWLYGVNRALIILPGGIKCADKPKKHLAFIGALMVLAFGMRRIINAWELLNSSTGVAAGAGYTDVNANLPGLYFTAFAAFVTALFFLSVFKTLKLKKAFISLGVLLVINIAATSAWPSFIQQFKVNPNEITLEKEYIEMDIKNTRKAYNVDKVTHKVFNIDNGLSQKETLKYESTLENIRLWEEEPMRKSIKQLQEMRLYYNFQSVFLDRYKIGRNLRQVHLSLRELDYSKVPSDAKTWINQHIKYTHGYGLCISPVNKVTDNGLPELMVRDIPPVSETDEFKNIDRPEIYFGELTDSYIFTNTSEEEFDYPMGEKNKYVKYAGSGGISIGSFLRKMLFSYHFWDMKILLTSYLNAESKIVFNRNIMSRVKALAPFLIYDNDPYAVIADPRDQKGKRIFWIVEGYTHTDRYPYSNPRYLSLGYRRFSRVNYIRNSVKIVVDAYNGEVAFYVSDSDDPVIKTYSKAFSKTFQPIENMPAQIKEHIRYPDFLFRLQADIYRRYHMQKPEVFYNQEDKWDVSQRKGNIAQYDYTKLQANYLIFQLPGEKNAEFVITLPYTPANKNNMVSMLIGRCDNDNYGELVCYNFPKEKLVYGPNQIEARIDQQKEISKMLTLWGQKGSQVIRGEILVVPVGSSLLYFQAMYLRASTGELPEFACIVAARESKIVLGKDLSDALTQLFKEDPEAEASIFDDPDIFDSSAALTSQSGAEGLYGSGPVSEAETGVAQDTDAALKVHTGAAVLSGSASKTADSGLKKTFGSNKLSKDFKSLAQRASKLFEEAEKSAAAGNWKQYGEKMDNLKKVIQQLGRENL
jgi:uncharacterized membrane protein (UPF0182 family)